MGRVRKYGRVLWVLMLLVAGTTPAAGHEQCRDCHAPGIPSADNLKQPLSDLCINCHLARIAEGEHAVDIPVKSAPASLPLKAGRMTCITCHDPHGKGRALRMSDPQLCTACHRR